MPQFLTSILPPPQHGVVEVLAPYVWVAVIACAVSLVATPVVRSLARRWGVVDRPDGLLKPHRRPIAYLGGVAVCLAWQGGLLYLWLKEPASRMWTAGLSLGGLVVMLVGLADDIVDLKPTLKLAGQVLAAVILMGFGVGPTIVTVIVRPMRILWPDLVCPGWLVTTLSVPITIFIVVAACNAANLLDGLDGLCSGVTAIISVMFLVLAAHLAMYGYSRAGDPVRIAASLAMVGAVLGFLPFNIAPATIFLGDAGSMLLGFFVAAMIIMFGEKGLPRWVLGASMIFGLPILDTSLALLRRVRLKRPIFGGDRSHLYDQLVDRGFSIRETVGICYGLSVFYGLVGVAIILLRTRYAIPVYVAVAAGTLVLCRRWGFLRPPMAVPREGSAGPGDSGEDGGGGESPAPG